MLTLQNYPSLLRRTPRLGDIHKQQSDMIMEATWNTDIGAKVAYLYDYYHDEQPKQFLDLEPYGEPVDIKFMVNTYNAENKDVQGFHIQFKPSHECALDYYHEYVEKWGNEYPIGLYISIPDEKGKLRKWLITEAANNLGTQFPTWYVLPIDHVFQWIVNGKYYEICGVSRSQNS